MDTAHSNALARKAELQRELAEVEQFLALYRKFESGKSSPRSSPVMPQTGTEQDRALPDSIPTVRYHTKPKRRGNPSAIADAVEALLREADRPMTRGELADGLAERGITIPSEDKARYVGTVLWRDADRFVNLEGRGYWLMQVANEPAGHSRADVDAYIGIRDATRRDDAERERAMREGRGHDSNSG